MEIYVNPSLSLSFINSNKAIAVANSDYKLVSCEQELLQDVLECIKRNNNDELVYKKYGSLFDKKTIQSFINALIKENILYKKETSEIKKCTIAVLGAKSYAETFTNLLPEEISCSVVTDNIEDICKTHSEFDCVVYLPESSKLEDLLKVNAKFIQVNLPFVLFRSDGESLFVGPLVIPYKGACLECFLNHHVDLLNEASGEELSLNSMKPLIFSKPWPSCFTKAEIEVAFSLLLQDVVKIKCDNVSFDLYERELCIKPGSLNHIVSHKFVPHTDCCTCHAMNSTCCYISDLSELKIPETPGPFSHKPISYEFGGLRSVSAEQTRELLETAMKKTGLNIEIKLDENNPFNEFIPVYDSLLKLTHKNKTPYYFGKQLSHGKGINRQQAYFSAAFEIFERLSARYFGELPLVRGSIRTLGSHCIDLKEATKVISKITTPYDPYNVDMPIDWVWGYSLIDECPRLVPASLVFLSNIRFRGHFVGCGSSGLAAGATLEDAIFQGLMEVVEHDAWMIGQAKSEKLPLISYQGIRRKSVREAIEKLRSVGVEVVSRDYTNDVQIPTFRTWIVDPNNYEDYAFEGFGASLDPEIALERSITEAVQGRGVITKGNDQKIVYAPGRVTGLADYRNSLYKLYYFRRKDMLPTGKTLDIGNYSVPRFNSVADAVKNAIAKIRKVAPNADIVFVNLTREAIGVPVVKVYVTNGLQWFGDPLLIPSQRLLGEKGKYEDLYLGSFPH